MKIWGGTAGARMCTLAMVATLAACGERGHEVSTGRRAETLGAFIGEVDATTGTITVTPIADGDAPSLALTYWTGLQVIPASQSGDWNSLPEGYVKLRTAASGTAIVPDACGPGVGSFEGNVEIHSGFSAAMLRSVYVEVTSMSAPSRESCQSSPPPYFQAPVAETYALFAYPDIAAGGTGSAKWSLRIPGDTTYFTFVGRVMAEVIETTRPATTATVTGPAVSLSCGDGTGSGCAKTTYTVDGGAAQEYFAPIHLGTIGTHDVCFHSEDRLGNVESPDGCVQVTVSEVAGYATYDGSIGAPKCDVASSCDTMPSGGSLTDSVIYGARPTEPHPSNTVDGCDDSVYYAGSRTVDEAIDRLVISADDHGPLAPGKAVTLTAYVNATGGTSDWFYGFYTPEMNGTSTVWHPLPGTAGTGVQAAASPAAQTFTMQFTLPDGAVAIRGHFGLGQLAADGNGAVFECAPGMYDNDDLVLTPNATLHGVAGPTASVASVAGATVSRTTLLTATTTDDGAVTQVAFSYRGSGDADWTPIAVDTAPPWVVAWDASAAFGTTYVRAIATDNAGNSTTSDAITVTVEDKTPPSVTMTVPAAGQSYSGSTTLTALASDPRGIAYVRWYVDGVQVGESTGPATYTATWNTAAPTAFASGSHQAWARATDLAGNISQTAAVQFTIP